MNRSIGDIFEAYVDSLVNLPSEVDDKIQELRVMDEEFQRRRDAFKKQKRVHLKRLQNDNRLAIRSSATGSPTTPSPTTSTLTASNSQSVEASLDLVEKEYMAAIDLQDQKINKARQMYDRLSMHIEQLDFQMAQNNISINSMCDHDMQQHHYHHHHHHRRFPYDYSSSSSSTSSSSSASASALASTLVYHPHMACGRPPTPVYTMALENSSPYHSRSSTSRTSRKNSYDAEGNRKITSSHGTTGSRKRTHYSARPDPPPNTGVLLDQEISPNEPRYCYCNQVSYGDMIACDGDNCEKEWFHYLCVGLEESPVGKWFCNDCLAN